jgi:hypothetical protein
MMKYTRKIDREMNYGLNTFLLYVFIVLLVILVASVCLYYYL